ncbi:choline transport protein [Aspergillus sclerotialis]|uniref:Choline transport protein n=1 Tax=Aspergillus sclerotialis TaxID=2070753 RepID=A0A3A3A1J3_9EURO|nr:choline transport protein [Aspergillus sclerotialis]
MPAVLAHVGLPTSNSDARIDNPSVIYGFILVFILQCFLGASLAEFVSAYPVEGGMYHWIAAIAPHKYNTLLSFATGWSTVFGCE